VGTFSGACPYFSLFSSLNALIALSPELSAVFWEQVMRRCFEVGTWPVLVVGFAVWAGLTFGVLMLMESLSAFLHALRLHWVEFLNKFYEGTGKPFEPFSFSRIIDEDAESHTVVNR
jgi:V-type H+-transporting ATPase subunit a